LRRRQEELVESERSLRLVVVPNGAGFDVLH